MAGLAWIFGNHDSALVFECLFFCSCKHCEISPSVQQKMPVLWTSARMRIRHLDLIYFEWSAACWHIPFRFHKTFYSRFGWLLWHVIGP